MKVVLIVLVLSIVIGVLMAPYDVDVISSDKAGTFNNANTVKATEIKPPQRHKSSVSATVKKDTVTGSNKPATNQTEALSPQMKEAVKAKLLHNAPLDIQQDEKKRTILKHNGRSTQVPVAVRQADGTIKIKEYSHITDDK